VCVVSSAESDCKCVFVCVCSVQCRVSMYGVVCVVCSAEREYRAVCVLSAEHTVTVGPYVCCVQCSVRL